MDTERIPPHPTPRCQRRGEMEESTRTKEILQNEAQRQRQRKEWGSIHKELNKTQNPSPMRVEVPISGITTKECTTNKEVEEGIGGEISERFSQANSTPICQGALFDLLLYSADTEAALPYSRAHLCHPRHDLNLDDHSRGNHKDMGENGHGQSGDQSQPRRLLIVLEESQGENGLVFLRIALWTLQSNCALRHPVQNACSEAFSHYKNGVSV